MIAIITQARINSTRLPNKILLEAGHKSFLLHHIERLRKTGLPIIVATTNNGSERPIVEFCKARDISCFCGDEHDVLKRYYQAAEQYKLSDIIRVTSDCPLIDPDIILQGLEAYRQCPPNTYYSNAVKRSYPRGMDYEIFSSDLLKEAFLEATDSSDREHVTPYIWKNRPGNVSVKNDVSEEDNSYYRITLDTVEDQQLITRLIEEFDAGELSCNAIVKILKNDPTLAKINELVEQKKV